jgi:hypothetical protein
MRSYLEKTNHRKRAGGVAQGVDPEFKPQYWKKKRINEKSWEGDSGGHSGPREYEVPGSVKAP